MFEKLSRFFKIFQVINPEVFIHHVSPVSELHWRKISKTWSSPFLYNPQAPRVPPLHHLEVEESSPSPSVSHHILYPSEAHFSSVQLDVPVKLVILGSKQVGKSALALRYLTKNQCDNLSNTGKYAFLKKMARWRL